MRGPARPGNDGESHQTTSEVITFIFLLYFRPLNSSPLIASDASLSRNLFFRVSSLTLMGIKLVFVMEGEAPKIKAETMNKRTLARYGGFKKTSTTTSTGRGRFKTVLKEVICSCPVLSQLLPLVVGFACLCDLSYPLSVLICWTYWECLG